MLDLIVWALIIGIVLIVIAGIMLIINVVNNQSSLIASITLIAFAIFFSIVGLCCIGAFILVALLQSLIDISDAIFSAVLGVASLTGVIGGVAISLRYSGKQKRMCESDPKCNLY